MNAFLNHLAQKKWFVPLILILMFLIALTSVAEFAPSKREESELSTVEQLEILCNSVNGVQNAKVMITYEAIPVSGWGSSSSNQEKILGIAIVCDGGDDPDVQLTLHKMIEALFGISSTRITVSQRNQV